MRRILISILFIPLFTMTGCTMFDKKEDTPTINHKAVKIKLEREIELLRLERRKILLQNSLDRLDAEVEKQLKD